MTHVGRPGPATAQEKAQAYADALRDDLRGKVGTPAEAHAKTELARAAKLAAIKETAT